MNIDRTKRLTGEALKAVQKRDREAVVSLACEGFFFTEEQNAFFDEMISLDVNDEERIAYVNAYLDRTL